MKGVISDHGIGGIQNISNAERPRAIAAFIFLAELALGYWVSVPVLAPPPAVGEGTAEARFVSIGGPMMWPRAAPGADRPISNSPDSITATNGLSHEKDTPASESGEEGGVEEGIATDDIRIVTIAPSRTQGLFTGDAVNFVATVEYNLASSRAGTVALRIEECLCAPGAVDPGMRFRETKSTAVTRGRRSVTLAHAIRVPAVRANTQLEVHAILQGSGPGSKSVEVKQAYSVTDNGKPPTGSQSWISIKSLEPAPEKPLRYGTVTDFFAVVSYNLMSEVGMLYFAIEDGTTTPLFYEYVRVNKGQRPITFYRHMRIPDSSSGTLTVTARLDQSEAHPTVVDGVRQTTQTPVPAASDARTFKVEGPQR